MPSDLPLSLVGWVAREQEQALMGPDVLPFWLTSFKPLRRSNLSDCSLALPSLLKAVPGGTKEHYAISLSG